jgi:serine/threonine protein kinase
VSINCFVTTAGVGWYWKIETVPLHALLGASSRDLDFFFKVAGQLSWILSELHRQGIIHRNVNPNSVLVNPDTLEVQLIDLSFASRTAGGGVAAYPSIVGRGAKLLRCTIFSGT